MSEKNIDGSARAHTIKYDDVVMSPPPSYISSTLNSRDNHDPPSSTQHAVESYYQAYPVGGIGGGGRHLRHNSNTNAPFTDVDLTPSGATSDTRSPNVVVCIGDEVKDDDTKRCAGVPIAMICFILGLCTWIGFIPGIYFLRSKNPKERRWARLCAIMCLTWALVIIFVSAVSEYHHYANGRYK